MKLSKDDDRKKPIWIFPDSPLPVLATFADCKMEISKTGANSFPVITMENTTDKITYKLSGWKCNTKELEKKTGKDDTDAWKGILCNVMLKDGKITLVPVEENI